MKIWKKTKFVLFKSSSIKKPGSPGFFFTAGDIRYQEIFDTAKKLHTELTCLGNNYFENPKGKDSQLFFIVQCKDVLKEAKPVLNQEPEWNLALRNLIKNLINCFISTITGGFLPNFFKVNKSKTALALDSLEVMVNLHFERPQMGY